MSEQLQTRLVPEDNVVALAITALVLSLAALLWQAWSWLHDGPVLRVEVSNVITDALSPGEPEHYLQIRVVNNGRGATTIRAWGISLPTGENYVIWRPLPISATLPVRLDSHADVDFYMLADDLRRHASTHGMLFKDMLPWADPAGGKRVFAKRPVPLS